MSTVLDYSTQNSAGLASAYRPATYSRAKHEPVHLDRTGAARHITSAIIYIDGTPNELIQEKKQSPLLLPLEMFRIKQDTDSGRVSVQLLTEPQLEEQG